MKPTRSLTWLRGQARLFSAPEEPGAAPSASPAGLLAEVCPDAQSFRFFLFREFRGELLSPGEFPAFPHAASDSLLFPPRSSMCQAGCSQKDPPSARPPERAPSGRRAQSSHPRAPVCREAWGEVAVHPVLRRPAPCAHRGVADSERHPVPRACSAAGPGRAMLANLSCTEPLAPRDPTVAVSAGSLPGRDWGGGFLSPPLPRCSKSPGSATALGHPVSAWTWASVSPSQGGTPHVASCWCHRA